MIELVNVAADPTGSGHKRRQQHALLMGAFSSYNSRRDDYVPCRQSLRLYEPQPHNNYGI